MANVRLTQIDGALPNLALMKLAHWHRAKGDTVTLTRQIERDLFEPVYDTVYASVIFRFSQDRLMQFMRQWPEAIVGGSGTPFSHTVADFIGGEYKHHDYTDYPDVDYSIGFTQRGCRLACQFCVVPKKEGKPRSANTIADIWRGKPHPKKLHLLDNDFFGNPDWRARIDEIREGEFRVCMSQGINIRLIDEEAAEALATIEYRNTKFQERRLYTAWDNLRDEAIFFRGVDMLEAAGVPPKHLMAYMLCGYDKNETWDRIWRRFHKMTERGIAPYPMVFDKARKDLVAFQRWVVTGLYRVVPWNEYERGTKSPESTAAFSRMVASVALMDVNWQSWASNLRQAPQQAVADLLRGAANIFPYERLTPHDFLLAVLPRASRLVTKHLLGEPDSAAPIPESNADLLNYLDSGLAAWLIEQCKAPPPPPLKLGAYAAQVCEALQWPLYFALPQTLEVLRADQNFSLQWLKSLYFADYCDPEYDYWQVLATHQTDDRLQFTWQSFVAEGERTRHERYRNLGLLALSKLPLSQAQSQQARECAPGSA